MIAAVVAFLCGRGVEALEGNARSKRSTTWERASMHRPCPPGAVVQHLLRKSWSYGLKPR